MSCIQNNMKRPLRYHKHKNQNTPSRWNASESIKNKKVGNAFPQYEENNKTFFLAGPAAALSLENPLAHNIWEVQEVLERSLGRWGGEVCCRKLL